MTNLCISKLTTIGSDDGLSPDWRQAIIWTNAGIVLIEPLGTNSSETLVEIYIFSFKKMHLKLSNWQLCLGLNVLTHKQLERNGCIPSTVATDALVLKHQAISIHSAG